MLDVSRNSVVKAFARRLSPEAQENVKTFWEEVQKEKEQKV